MFDGFSDETLRFLSRVKKNNNRDWFQKNRSTFDSEVMDRAKAFVVAMEDPLRKISPDINVEPRVNASIRRINRDTRFSKDKTPYKDYQDFFFRYAGAGKEGPGYFVRITAKKFILGAGTHVFDKTELQRYRDAVAGRAGAKLATAVTSVRKSGYGVGGEHYKRVPRGFDPDHARADLLRYAGLFAYLEVDVPKQFYSRSLTTFCAKHFTRLAPLSEWLYRNVTDAS